MYLALLTAFRTNEEIKHINKMKEKKSTSAPKNGFCSANIHLKRKGKKPLHKKMKIKIKSNSAPKNGPG